MVGPPKHVYSVDVMNNSEGPLKVQVHYDNHRDGVEDVDTCEIPSGSTHHFPEKTLNMGGWTAVAPVKVIKTSAGHHLTPSVQGIVKKLTVHATTAGLKQIGP